MYSDNTTSAIHATITRNAIADNGAVYGGTMAPAGVLRYTSGATEERTLTLSGLSADKTYSLELYASRDNKSNATIFTLNGTAITIVTDSNTTAKALFTNLKASAAGQLVLGIKGLNDYNYLNGFILSERNGITTTMAAQMKARPVEEQAASGLQVQAFPNPTQHYFSLRIQGQSNKPVQLRIVDVLGRIVEAKQGIAANTTLTIGHTYRPGVYYIQVLQSNQKATLKIVKGTP
jgi:hypothetical protein